MRCTIIFIWCLSCQSVNSYLWNDIWSYFYQKDQHEVTESCDDTWISTDIKGLSRTLHENLYGQHIAIDSVVKLLKAHTRKNPEKALSLSFHGWSGSGKTYTSTIIAEKMFKKGVDSQYVHLISAIKEFPHHAHEDSMREYKDNLKAQIENAVKQCERSMFIFEEMHRAPPGLVDTLKPYLDFHIKVGGLDYRKATFLFLSNTEGPEITEFTINAFKEGRIREDLQLKEVENVIRLHALNNNSGLWHSELISDNLITAFVPFLPLERVHVKQCIRYALVDKEYATAERMPELTVQQIADELTYFPKGIERFSASGCKRVLDKVYLHFNKDEF